VLGEFPADVQGYVAMVLAYPTAAQSAAAKELISSSWHPRGAARHQEEGDGEVMR
jgi:hypothetical protein